ncbi:hypothetical protein HSX11_25790 [Oxalobacteraceae bacterium]|nr:hypothetical protein [Oxalobacteraceae bacterium]
MQKIISELTRLYLPAGSISPEALAQRLRGLSTQTISLATADGQTRAIAIPFRKISSGDDAAHWTRLCEVANVLQSVFNFPAPAVSISGIDGYCLWLSLEAPIAAAQAQQFMELLHAAHFSDMALSPDAALAPVELPPCLHTDTGKWAAFIHPDLGASFADESGLEMAPPCSGQAALLEGLQRISKAQFQHALNALQQSHGTAPVDSAPAPVPVVAPEGLLLKDATLEDIVRFLHSKNIEPTFRHLIST